MDNKTKYYWAGQGQHWEAEVCKDCRCYQFQRPLINGRCDFCDMAEQDRQQLTRSN